MWIPQPGSLTVPTRDSFVCVLSTVAHSRLFQSKSWLLLQVIFGILGEFSRKDQSVLFNFGRIFMIVSNTESYDISKSTGRSTCILSIQNPNIMNKPRIMTQSKLVVYESTAHSVDDGPVNCQRLVPLRLASPLPFPMKCLQPIRRFMLQI